jgi:hypothetical protein
MSISVSEVIFSQDILAAIRAEFGGTAAVDNSACQPLDDSFSAFRSCSINSGTDALR